MTATVPTHQMQALAAELESAEASARPIEPLSERFPGLTEADAYAIQDITLRRRLAAGATLSGHKIGLTSEAMRRQLGVEDPDYGYVLSSRVLRSGDRLPASELIAPMIEAELAVELSRDLEPPVTPDQVAAATAAVHASLEIIDSRVRDWRIGLIDTVADNASCARVILGESTANPPALPEVGLRLFRNGEQAATGQGSDVLGDPLRAVAWLADTLHRYGRRVRAGQVVFTGSLHAALPVVAGDHVEARFEGIGAVSIHIT
ncbi:2-keto-4-pentenoate hydratase [Pseudonocardia zijingensis]|uniref:Fumarylacetoacetate hydrolase family protein n=1 Tax=Pseudonocardia zijingensis TaxID=153376 RepID=A0ABN1NK60_9PSEU